MSGPRETARQIAERAIEGIITDLVTLGAFKAESNAADNFRQILNNRLASLTADLAQAKDEVIRQEALVTILAEGQTRLRADLAQVQQAEKEVRVRLDYRCPDCGGPRLWDSRWQGVDCHFCLKNENDALDNKLAAAEQARGEALAQATRNIMLYTVRGHEAGVKHGARTALLEAAEDADKRFHNDAFSQWLTTRAGGPRTLAHSFAPSAWQAAVEEFDRHSVQDITDLLAALDTAKAEGRRQGIEEAVRVVVDAGSEEDTAPPGTRSQTRWRLCRTIADRVRQCLPETPR